MSEEADTEEADAEVAELIGRTIAAAVESGWNREAFDDVVDSIWTDVQRMFARHLVEEALAEAFTDK